MLEILIGFLVFCAVVAIGAAVLAIFGDRRQTIQSRLSPAGVEGVYDPFAQEPGGLVSVVRKVGSAASKGKTSAPLRQRLAEAGYHRDSAAAVFIGIKILMLILGIMSSTVLVMVLGDLSTLMKITIVFGSGTVLSFVPNMVVSVRRDRRCTEVRRHLPDAVDLMEVCVTAGMGLDMSWNAVGDEMRRVSPVLADEMALTNLEIQLGARRADAMRNMARRTQAKELGSLVAVLVQTERFGTSIGDALRSFAGSMREARSLLAEETGEKMAVKLLFPMVLFIFPAMLLVLVGPTAVQLAKMMAEH